MKQKRLLSLAIFFLGIGYASISTTLNITGDLKLALNYADFGVKIIKASLEGSSTTISEDGQTVTFNTSSLSTVGDKKTLDFTVINNSEQYDAEVNLVCVAEETKPDNFQMTSDSIIIPGKRTGNGQVSIELVNAETTNTPDAFVCTLNGIPKGRTTKADGQTLYKVLQDEAESGSGLAIEYTGAHQDSFFGGGIKKIYHYYASDSTNATTVLNKNNVVFAGQCWQIVRTTDTGGVKMIYNGEAVDNKCLSTRGTHVGYSNNSLFASSQELSGNYYYGTDYTYDASKKTFSLAGTLTQATWSDSTYSSLIGKYTCLSTNSVGTCSTLYYVESYVSASNAGVLSLGNASHYSQIGTVPFNISYFSTAYVGYMYNAVYRYSSVSNSSSGKLDGSTDNRWYFGNDVNYENGVYKLVNSERFDLSSDYNKINNNHYTCLSKNSSCEVVKYIYYTDSSKSYYIDLTGGKKVDDALLEMLSKDNVNSKNSTMKTAIDAWYEKYLKNYTKYLEDTVYCNNRSISELNGWNPNGGNTGVFLYFKENGTKDLSCSNITDRFSILNEKAKLKYPVGLMTISEMNLLGNSEVRKTGQHYWTMSPYYGGSLYAFEFRVNSDGALNNNSFNSSGSTGVRPAVSLAPGTMYIEGDGSMENPYIVN